MTKTDIRARRAGWSGVCAAVLMILTGAPAALAGSQVPEDLAITGPEFADLSGDRTLVYRDATGAVVGAERHLPDGRVVWADAQGDCTTGAWRATKSRICFYYEDAPRSPVCWIMHRRGAGVEATLVTGEKRITLIAEPSERPLICSADLGV